MALLMVIGSIAAERVAAAMGAHRSVGPAMSLMAAGRLPDCSASR